MLGLLKLLYWFFFGNHETTAGVCEDENGQWVGRCDAVIRVDVCLQTDIVDYSSESETYRRRVERTRGKSQAEDAPITENLRHSNAPGESDGVSQSVGSVIQMTNCSFRGNGEDDGNNPNVPNPIVEININTPEKGENSHEASTIKQTVGSVVQIVGSVGGGETKSTTTSGGTFPEEINESAHNNCVDISVGSDNQTLANVLRVGYLDETDKASSLLNESTLPNENIEGDSRISHAQTVKNIIEIQDNSRQMSEENVQVEAINEKLKQQELEIEKLHELINALQNKLEILQTNSPERDSEVGTLDTLREHVEKRLLDFEESCTYLSEAMVSMNESHKLEMQQLKERILELESRVENLPEDDQADDGTFQVTEEDIEQLAQEWENRLRTGHNRLKQHMFRKLRIGESEMCPCGTAPENAEHVLQTCPLYHSNRSALWSQETTLNVKLYGGLEQLTTTAQFVTNIGLVVWILQLTFENEEEEVQSILIKILVAMVASHQMCAFELITF